MTDEEILEAVYKTAFDYINSVVPPKMIQDLDISVTKDDADITIDIQLVTTGRRTSTSVRWKRPSRSLQKKPMS